jgi:hypothetical protein
LVRRWCRVGVARVPQTCRQSISADVAKPLGQLASSDRNKWP